MTPGMQLQYMQIYQCDIYHINKLREKNHKIISTDGEKAFEKTSVPIYDKTLKKIGIEETTST